jgi:hypothetical protein
MIEMISALSRRYEAGDPYQPHHFCVMFIDLAITKSLGETRTKEQTGQRQTRSKRGPETDKKQERARDRQEAREGQTSKKPTRDKLF